MKLGDRVMGRYQLVSELGSGGVGVVYRALDLERGEDVALKSLRHLSARGIAYIKNEFRTLADFVHPNVVQLHELATDRDEWFFTMELVEGQPLTEYVWAGARRGGASRSEPADDDGAPGRVRSPADFGRLRAVLPQLAQAIQAIHEAGKLHRDIKPSNVLVTSAGRVVLLDFGLGIELTPPFPGPRRPVAVAGTPQYMAPEQFGGGPPAPAADWYAMGALLYETLTGHTPAEGRTTDRLLADGDWSPVPPSQRVAGLPTDLADLCRDLLRPQPEERPRGPEVIRRLTQAGIDVCWLTPWDELSAGRALVGRREELAALQAAFDEVRTGRAAVCLVHGPSGAGKTSLVRAFLEGIAGQPGVVILPGRCHEHESVPYKAFDAIVDGLGSHLDQAPGCEVRALLPPDVEALVRLFPILDRVEVIAATARRAEGILDPVELRSRGVGALRRLLARVAAEHRLVLVIDDLQWGDVDSADLLLELLRPPDAPALLLIACYHSEDASRSACLARLLAERDPAARPLRARRIAVSPLPDPDARALASRLLGGAGEAAGATAERIVAEAAGHPYLVEELARHARGRPGGALTPGDDSPLDLNGVLCARVAGLPAAERHLLELLAVHDGPLTRAELLEAAALGVQGHAAINNLRANRLVRASLGRPNGSSHIRIESYHDRIRVAARTRLSREANEAHHRRLASALAASPTADPEALAVHLQAIGDRAGAAHQLARAADHAAETLAFDRAVTLYRRSLDIWIENGRGRRAVELKAADALANAGRGFEAAKLYAGLVAEADPEERLGLLRACGYQYCVSGRIPEGRAVFAELLPALGLSGPASRRTVIPRLLWHRARLAIQRRLGRCAVKRVPSALDLTRCDVLWEAAAGLANVEMATAAELFSRSLLLALRSGDSGRIARALALDAGARATEGERQWPRVRAELDRARELARGIGDPHAEALVHLMSGATSYGRGRWAEGVPELALAESTLKERCVGVAWELETAQHLQVCCLVPAGAWRELIARCDAYWTEAQERGARQMTLMLGAYGAPHAALASGDPERARALLREAEAESARLGAVNVNPVYTQAQIDLYEGRPEGVGDRITAAWPVVRRSGWLRHQGFRSMLRYHRALAALSCAGVSTDAERSTREAESDIRAMERERLAWLAPLAGALRATCAVARGDRDGAVTSFESAIRGLEEASMATYAASTRRRLGELLGGSEGRALVAEADQQLVAQGIADPLRMARMHTPPLPASGR